MPSTMPPLVVREAEQVVGAQPGLDVLERHVVDRLAVGERVVEVLEHLRAAGLMSISSNVTPERLGQPRRVALGEVAGREARQRVGEDVAARPAEPVHRARGDDQRVGGVEAAGDADDDLRAGRCARSRCSSPETWML